MNFKYFCKKSFFVCANILGVTFLVVLILGAVASWRLLHAPVDLEFAKPYLQDALKDEATGLTVTMDKLALFWPAVNDPLLLGLQGAEVKDANGTVIASIDEVALNLHKAQLLLGRVRLEGLIVKRPNLSVVRTRDNALHIGVADLQNFGPPEMQDDDESNIVEMIMEVLSGKDQQSQTVQLSALKSFAVDDARIFIDDRVLNVSWSLPHADVYLSRDDNLLEGRLVLENSDELIEVEATPLEAGMLLDTETGNIDIRAELNRFELWKLGEKVPELDVLAQQNMVVNGHLQASVTKDLSVKSAIVNLESPSGEFNIAEWSADPVPFENLAIDMQYYNADKTLEVSQFAIDLPEIPVRGAAKFAMDGEAVTGDVRAEIEDVQHSAIEPLWPVALEEDNAREWVVEKLSGGAFSNLFVDTQFVISDINAEEPAFEIEALEAGFDFDGVDIDYRSPLAPATDTVGTGRFDYTTDILKIDIDTGKILDMDVSDGEVELLYVVAEGKGTADVHFDLKGPVKSVLEYIKADPINANHEIDVANSKGRAEMVVNIHLPTKDDVAMSEVKIDINGTVTDASLPNVVKGMTLSGGPFAAKVKDNRLTVSGKGLLDGQPIEAEYREFLESEGQAYKMQVAAKGTATEAMRAKFGIDLSDFLAGPAYVDVVYTETSDVNANAVVNANLRNTQLFVDPFDYLKERGSDASASFKAVLKNGSVQRIEDLTGNAPTLVLDKSTIMFRQDQNGEDELASGSISRFVLGETVGALDFEIMPAGTIKFIMAGPYLDLRPFLNEDTKDGVQEPYTNPRIQISAKADTMRTADEETIEYGQIYADLDEQGKFNQLELDAVAGGGDIYLRYKPDEQGRRVFRMEADNAGATLRAFGLYENIRGGKLVIYAEPKGGLRDKNLVGSAEMTDFRVVKAPTLARLLSIMSLPGLSSALNGEGLGFSKLEASFDWLFRQQGSLLVLKDGRTSGNSLGLTFDGTFDNAAGMLDVKGTIIPLAGVNEIIGNIPIVGDIITGGTGALIAATYSLTGNSEEPEVSVNPLSVLTPGILRRILFQN
ncbi:MAG: hypothetical protein JKY71_12165 [Alphaproteobacteria bacterium]|nr:hypothetical protein [Alphaproteobacteria bacterium]